MSAVRREDGFTLLEVLVALVVLGFLMAGLAGGVRLGMQAWNAQDRAIAVHGDLDAVDRVLRRLIEQADPGDPTHAAGIAGDASRLVLETRLPAASDRAVDAALLVDARHQLVLRWAPRRFGKPIGPPPPTQDTELLDGVASVQFAYWPRGAPMARVSAGAAPGTARTLRPWSASGWPSPMPPGTGRTSLPPRSGTGCGEYPAKNISAGPRPQLPSWIVRQFEWGHRATPSYSAALRGVGSASGSCAPTPTNSTKSVILCRGGGLSSNCSMANSGPMLSRLGVCLPTKSPIG